MLNEVLEFWEVFVHKHRALMQKSEVGGWGQFDVQDHATRVRGIFLIGISQEQSECRAEDMDTPLYISDKRVQ